MYESLVQQCLHAGDSSSFQDAIVCNFVLPGDLLDAVETVHVECIELLFLLDSQGPGLTAVQESAENAGSVDLDFGVLGQLGVGPYSLCQS